MGGNKPINLKLIKWSKWVDQIHKDVESLLENQVIYRGYLDIIKTNVTIQSPADFHEWVRKNYATSVVMNIRRQMDPGKDAISLRRLLEEIEQRPNLITKTWYKSLYGLGPQPFAEIDFESLAGTDLYFDREIALNDIKKLEQLSNKIKEYATKRIAHNLRQSVKNQPNYNDLDNFIEELEKIVCRYVQLFTGSAYPSLTPVWQYDWTSIFKKPWIKK